MARSIVLFLSAFLLLSAQAYAATLEVSVAGTGTACSEASPCSMDEAMDQGQAGDTVLVNDGNYPLAAGCPFDAGSICTHRSGTSTSPITFQSKNRHGAVLTRGIKVLHSFHHFIGFRITGRTSGGFSVPLEIRGNKTVFRQIKGTVVTDINLTVNEDTALVKIAGADGTIVRWSRFERLLKEQGNGEGFYMGDVTDSTNRSAGNSQIYANTVIDTIYECFDWKGGSEGNDIHHNICDGAGRLTPDGIGAAGLAMSGMIAGGGGTGGNRMHNNILKNGRSPSWGGCYFIQNNGQPSNRYDHNVCRDMLSPSSLMGTSNDSVQGELDNNTYCNLNNYTYQNSLSLNIHDESTNQAASVCDAEETRILTEMQELAGNPTPGADPPPPDTTPANCVTSTENAITSAGVESQTAAFTWDFKATPKAGTNMLVGLAGVTVGSLSDFAAIIRFNPSGNIDVRNGGVYAADTVFPYSIGTTYTISVTGSVSTKKYTVVVGETTIATNYDFRTEQAAVGVLDRWGLWAGTGGSLEVCDVVVASTETEPIVSTFNQFSFRGSQILGRTAEASPVWIAAENTNFKVAPQSIFGLRTKIVVKVNDPGSEGFKLYCAKNGGAYAALTNVFTAGIRMLGSHPDVIADGTLTTRLLTQEEATFVEGRIWLTDSPMTWDAALDSEGEHEWGVQLDNTVVVGDFYDCRVRKSDGTQLGTYTQTPRITVQDYQAGGGF